MREQTKDHRGIVVKGMAHLMAPQVIETRPRAVRDVFSERRSASYYTVKGIRHPSHEHYSREGEQWKPRRKEFIVEFKELLAGAMPDKFIICSIDRERERYTETETDTERDME